MARKFLTDINLDGNQLTNASLEKLSADPISGLFEGRMYYNTAIDKIKYYNGTAWVVIGEAGDIALGTNTSGNYVAEISQGTGITVTGSGSETATVTITNSDPGSAQSIFKNVAVSGQNTITAETNNDTLTVASGTGISITTNDTTDTLTIGNSGVTSIAGTTDQISASASTGSVTLSLPQNIATTSNPTFAGVNAGNINVGITGDNEIDTDSGNLTIDSAGGTVTVDDNLVVTGDLTVSGTTTTINTQTLSVADNIVTLNSDFTTGSPTENAGIEVLRGSSATVSIRWNETSDTWELTRDGTTYEEITTVGTISSGDISDFAEAAQDAVGAMIVDGTTIDLTYTDATPSLTAEVKLAGTSYLGTTGGLSVDIASVETKLVTDGFTKKATANIGNGSATSFVVTHGLGTRDVLIQVYTNAAPYDQVEADILHYDVSDAGNVNKITIAFASAPALDAYRVVVIG